LGGDIVYPSQFVRCIECAFKNLFFIRKVAKGLPHFKPFSPGELSGLDDVGAALAAH
jgi:hypothetical protein